MSIASHSAGDAFYPPAPRMSSPNFPIPTDPNVEKRWSQLLKDHGVVFGVTSRAAFTPYTVVVAWLFQVMSVKKCCREALCWFVLWRADLNVSTLDTGNYCTARAKLRVSALRAICRDVAKDMDSTVNGHWSWKGRDVYLADGSTTTAPDTVKNQARYPQPKSQKPGLGFPIVRLVMLFSLATAALHDAQMGPYKGKETGETALFRMMIADLPERSVIVADRFYCSYMMIALLLAAGHDVLFRQHQRRSTNLRNGRIVGRSSGSMVTWTRPERPDWMTMEEYEQIPQTLTVWMIKSRISVPGYRVNELTVVTTLSPEDHTAKEILDLYLERWNVELDIRSIKSTLEMDVLRCQSPEVLELEIWIHLLAYNLTRAQSVAAAKRANRCGREISFAASLQLLRMRMAIAISPTARTVEELNELILLLLSGERVGDRPGRCEPRAVKRRPKKQKLLTEPRQQAREKLLQRTSSNE